MRGRRPDILGYEAKQSSFTIKQCSIVCVLILLFLGVFWSLSVRGSTEANYVHLQRIIDTQQQQIDSLTQNSRDWKEKINGESHKAANTIGIVEKRVQDFETQLENIITDFDLLKRNMKSHIDSNENYFIDHIKTLEEQIAKIHEDIQQLSENENQIIYHMNQLESKFQKQIEDNMLDLRKEIEDQLEGNNQQLNLILASTNNRDKPTTENELEKEVDGVFDEYLEKNQEEELIEAEEIYLVIIDIGAILEKYTTTSKIFPCSDSEAIGEPSIERVFASVQSFDTGDNLIIISTTYSRESSFHELKNNSRVVIIASENTSGYGDLSNAAVEFLGPNKADGLLIFVYPGSTTPNSVDFIEKITRPLVDDYYYFDIGIVSSLTVDPRNGKVISAGTEVAEESSGFVPHLRYRGYLAHDARTYSPSIIPAASVYGVYSLSVALYNSIGGMLSDKYTSYTPAQHVYDLCLTISEEQLHIDQDPEDDEDESGVCLLNERHDVFYQSDAVVYLETTTCDESLIAINPLEIQSVEFADRWSNFLNMVFFEPKVVLPINVVWELANTCNLSSEVITFPLGLEYNTRLYIDTEKVTNENSCENQIEYVNQAFYRLSTKTRPQTIEFKIYDLNNANWNVEHLQLNSKAPSGNLPKFTIGKLNEDFLISNLTEQHFAIMQFLDQIWVPSSYLKHSLLQLIESLDADKVEVLVPGIDVYLFDPEIIPPIVFPFDDFAFDFLSIIDIHSPFTWKPILDAFNNQFSMEDEVSLIIYPLPPYTSDSLLPLDEYLISLNISNHVKIFTQPLNSQLDFARLFKAVDGFIYTSFSSPSSFHLQQAMSMTLPCIAPSIGGHTDFMNEENSYLVESDKPEGNFWTTGAVDELQKAMQNVVVNSFEAREKGLKARKHMVDRYTLSKYTNRILDVLDSFSF